MSDSNFSAIRARLRYESIEEFIAGYSRFISAGGMFIPMAPNKLKPIGTTIRFQFLLADSSTALLGEGLVVQARPPEDGNPNAPVGMLVKFSKLSQESKNLVDQIVAMKEFGAIGSAQVSEAADEADEEVAREAPDSFADDDATHEVNLQEYLARDEAIRAEEPTEAEAADVQSEPAPSEAEVEAEVPDLGAQVSEEDGDEETQTAHGPRKLGQTAGGLQILAFDDMSEEEADALEFDLGAEESDIDEMFAGLFGGGGGGGEDELFGDFGGDATPDPDEPEDSVESEDELFVEPSEPDEEDAHDDAADEDDEPDEVEAAVELQSDLESEVSEADEEDEEYEEDEPLPGYGHDDGAASLTFPDDWSEAESVEPSEAASSEGDDAPAMDEAPADDDVDDEVASVSVDEAFEDSQPFDESQPEEEPAQSDEEDLDAEESDAEEPAAEEPADLVAEEAESEAEELLLESDAVMLIEGSEAEMLFDEAEDEVEEEPQQSALEEFADFIPADNDEGEDEEPASPPAEIEFADEGPSELENLLGNLESDPRDDEEHELELHLSNDPLASFDNDEPEFDDEPGPESDEESLDFLLAAAGREIQARRSDEPEGGDDHDLLDELLGDAANLPPPPGDSPTFAPPEPKKKKGGFLSKLFGKD